MSLASDPHALRALLGDSPGTSAEQILNALSRFELAAQAASTRFGGVCLVGLSNYFASKLAEVSAPARLEQLDRYRLEDLCLAYAAATGSSSAIAEIEALISKNCARWVRSTGADPADVGQLTLTSLLVPVGSAPARILDYRGTAPLTAFLRIVCTRAAISMARKVLAESNLSLSYEVVAPGTDPELRALRERFRAPFASALRVALANLQPRHKTILKLHFARGVAVAELAVLYKVHRVSMSRWIADAKAEVFEFTRAAIRKEIPMRDSEFDSVLRLLKSEIDFKLSSLRQDDVS